MNKIIRFFISGVTGLIVNMGTLYLFADIIHFWYLLSSILAFSIAVIASFILQKYWAFEDKNNSNIHIQASVYIITSIINLAMNTLFVFIFVEKIFLNHLLAQFLASGIIAIWSYFVYDRIIFKNNKDIADIIPNEKDKS